MKPQRRVFVVGGAQTPFLGRARPEFLSFRDTRKGLGRNPSAEEHLRAAVLGALSATGVDPAAIDRAWLSNFLGECFVRQGHMGAMLAAAHPALEGKPIARMEAACASGGVCLATAVDALQAVCDVALVAGVEVETNVKGGEGVDHMALAAHWEKQRGISEFVFPHLFARRARAWKEAYGGTSRDLAGVVWKSRRHARDNPDALHHHTDTSLDALDTVSDHNRTFLEDPDLHDHMRIADSTEFTDGAAAVILATEAGLARLGLRPDDCTELLSYGFSVRALGAETDPTRLVNVAAAARQALGDAGLAPADVDVAEVHDCFSVTEAQHYAALGFCTDAEAPSAMRAGAFERDGQVAVNPSGGLLGAGHPIGATGVRQALDLWRQLRGRAGACQVPGSPRIGLSSNLGGDDRTGVVMVQRAL